MKCLVKERLQEIGKSQGWLSQKIGIQRTYLNKICNAKSIPLVSTTDKIAKALGVPIEFLWIFDK